MAETVNVKRIELPPKPGKPQPFDWHEHLVSHDDLLAKYIEPIDFLIDEILISYGTGVLAAPKKKGKSWMALQLSQAIACGADFLGFKTKQGRVVYFALEDGERRIQQRLRQQNTTAGLDIQYFYQWPAWNTQTGFNQLKTMLQELKPALVIVDTFVKCLNGKPDQNSAGDMGEFGNRIHDLALELNLMILFIAHHGKMSNRDPGFDIRGSSAIPGATDVNIGLYKNDDGTFDLIGEGRDIPEFDLRIKLDKEITWCWQLEGEAKDIRRVETETKILQALELLGKCDAQAVANEIGTSRENASIHLKRMREYESPLVNFEVTQSGKQKTIIYSLFKSFNSFTYNNHLHRLQGNNGVNDVNKKDIAL